MKFNSIYYLLILVLFIFFQYFGIYSQDNRIKGKEINLYLILNYIIKEKEEEEEEEEKEEEKEKKKMSFLSIINFFYFYFFYHFR